MRKLLRNPWVLNVLVLLAAAALLWPFFWDLVYALNLGEEQSTAGKFPVTLQDNAELFSQGERESLKQSMASVSVYCPTALRTTKDAGSLSTGALAERLYEQLYPRKEGVLFLIDMDNRGIWVQAGDKNRLLTTGLCESITDNVYRYASAGDFFRCAQGVFRQIRSVMAEGRVPEPMKHLSNALIAFCLGLMAVFWAACRENDVKRPNEVYQLDRRAHRSITIEDGKHWTLNEVDYAAVGSALLGGLAKAVFESSDSSSDSGGWSSGSSSGGGSSRSSGSFGGGSSRSGGSSGGSRSSGSSGSSSGGSHGGGHRF